MNNGVLFDVSDLWHLPDPLDDGVGETASVALEVTVIDLADPNGTVGEKRTLFMSSLEEVEMVVQGGGAVVVLQHDNVWMVEDLVGVLSLEGIKGASARGDLCLRMS